MRSVKISEFLKPERVILDLQADSKSEAIRALAEKVRGADEVESFPDFIKAVYDREDIATTGIGCGIGIPHARTDAVSRFLVIFGRSKNGIPFQALDDKPVHFVFLLATPQECLKDYLLILARLSQLMKSSEFRDKLGMAESPAQVIELFQKSETGLENHKVHC